MLTSKQIYELTSDIFPDYITYFFLSDQEISSLQKKGLIWEIETKSLAFFFKSLKQFIIKTVADFIFFLLTDPFINYLFDL